MFGFTTVLSVSISLLLASQSVVAVPNPASRGTRSLLFSIRSDSDPTIVPQCESQCEKLEDAIGNSTSPAALCTNLIISQFEACFDCEAKAGAATTATLQESVNSFVSSCADIDHPVNNVTIAAKSTNGGERLSLGTVGSIVLGLVTALLAAL
ncbi:hypothetical protein C8R44DRAFT_766890 [Mycena epipterygia]|nr:hypothetical protein C8R44DRAFT_766890 [Mycena epipterygia]